jgi:hypothetical protein
MGKLNSCCHHFSSQGERQRWLIQTKTNALHLKEDIGRCKKFTVLKDLRLSDHLFRKEANAATPAGD